MGYSITHEQHERIEENRRLGRLCQGSSRCGTRATKAVYQRTWAYHIDEGPMLPSDKPLVMCAKHANEYKPGYRGVNFIVDTIVNLPRLTR